MKNTYGKYRVAVVAVILIGWQPQAKAFMGVGDVVTDPGLTMKVIAAEAARVGQTATMINNQIMHIQNAVQNTLSLADPVFAPLGNTLRSLSGMYMQGQSLMYQAQNIDQRFAMMNPGYLSYLHSMGRGGATMSSMYEKWSEQGNQTTRQALLNAGIQVKDAEDTQSMLQKLILQSNMAGGQVRALQAANQIAASQHQQIQELRVALAQQTMLHAEYMAQQNARQSASDALQIQFRGNNPFRVPAQGF